MALWFTVHITQQGPGPSVGTIGHVEIRRLTANPGQYRPAEYVVELDSREVGRLIHSYGTGAFGLIAEAARLVAEDRGEETLLAAAQVLTTDTAREGT